MDPKGKNIICLDYSVLQYEKHFAIQNAIQNTLSCATKSKNIPGVFTQDIEEICIFATFMCLLKHSYITVR